jgi:hypothetical protein
VRAVSGRCDPRVGPRSRVATLQRSCIIPTTRMTPT